MEALLTRGAVAAIAASKMWELAPAAQRAVLQVVDVTWMAVEPRTELGEWRRQWKGSHSMVLSDGVHTLGEFSLCGTDKIGIFQFEVLQTECALIGSPMPYQRGLKHGDLDARSSDGNVAPKIKYQWPS